MKTTTTYATFRRTAIVLLAAAAVAPSISSAQTAPGFHFESICRSDPGASKNKVTVTLHGPDDVVFQSQAHDLLAGVTINALWTFVDYRQNRAVFRYRLDSCTTGADGSCTFSGGSQRARWQLSEVVGYELSSPAFDTDATPTCPNSMMIDFW